MAVDARKKDIDMLSKILSYKSLLYRNKLQLINNKNKQKKIIASIKLE